MFYDGNNAESALAPVPSPGHLRKICTEPRAFVQ